jgi:hypothetical protein
MKIASHVIILARKLKKKKIKEKGHSYAIITCEKIREFDSFTAANAYYSEKENGFCFLA